jgi:dynein assembly factor 3
MQFYIFARPLEAVGRDLLLMGVAFDWTVPLRQRAHAWLEIFGNTLLPERTSRYLAKQRLALIKLVCGDADAGFLRHVVDLSLLKYKQRDALHAIFASWAHSVQADSK